MKHLILTSILLAVILTSGCHRWVPQKFLEDTADVLDIAVKVSERKTPMPKSVTANETAVFKETAVVCREYAD